MNRFDRADSLPFIVYEDNHIIVVVKPQGLLCQGDIGGSENLLDLLREYIRESAHKPGNVYIGLVHRLDRNTGGLMVFAKTSKAAARLSEQFREHTVSKHYLAAVEHRPEPPENSMQDHLKKDGRLKKAVIASANDPEAKKAELRYRWIGERRRSQTRPPLQIVEVELLTGRFHQIRAQFAHHRLPLAGDTKYGSTLRLGGPALWAHRLEFMHPTRKELMRFEFEPPAEWPFGFRRDRAADVAREDD